MSSKIYFNTSSKFNIKKKVLNLITRLHHVLAPKHAEKTAYKVLLTPVRTKPKSPEPEGIIKETIDSKVGRLKTYRLGNGPVWVLTHGWSGSASQFFNLMEHIAAQGFTALAYDHPGHGQSEGKQSHMPAFVHGLESVLDSVENLAGLVAHSMGCASAIECKHTKLEGKPFLFVAPVLNYLDNLFSTVTKSGFSLRLFESVVHKIHDQYSYPLQSINPYQKLGLRTAKTIIVHDEQDRFSAFSVSQQAASEMANVSLVSTKGQGHGRVLKSPQLTHAFGTLLV